jgi:hypothetical protein
MADKKAPGKGEVSIYKFYNVQGDKVTRTKRVAMGPSWQSTRTGLPVASAALLSSLTRKVPRRAKSKKVLSGNSLYFFFDCLRY